MRPSRVRLGPSGLSPSPDAWVLRLWLGYQRNLAAGIIWRIQLNLRALGQRPTLIPISVQPDGSPPGFRIHEGQSGQLTNTFSF